MTDDRLLTAEQVQIALGPHVPIPCACDPSTHTEMCARCEYAWPCPTKRLADHIAVLTEQVERQAAIVAWNWGECPNEQLELLERYLGFDFTQESIDRLNSEIEAIRRYGVEVAGRQG